MNTNTKTQMQLASAVKALKQISSEYPGERDHPGVMARKTLRQLGHKPA